MKGTKSRKRQRESENDNEVTFCADVATSGPDPAATASSKNPAKALPSHISPARRRRRSAQVSKCPVCLKSLYKAVMSIADINDHINRCSDAQFAEAKPKVLLEKKKLKLDTKGNVRKESRDAASARAASLQCLRKEGATKQSFELLLMKHLDP